MAQEYCIGCTAPLLHLDRDPNGDVNATCKRCVAEEGHDFDTEPDATFDRIGNREEFHTIPLTSTRFHMSTINHVPTLRALALSILQNARQFDWTLQGFGMLRLHMGDFRLHVWDRRFAVPNVSVIHDHKQWALQSTILSGELHNYRFTEYRDGDVCAPMSERYNKFTILAGAGGGPTKESVTERTWLYRNPPEILLPGMTYTQEPDEIHESRPINGTVTIMRKSPTNTDEARVFWPWGTEWVSAEPRAATPKEVSHIVEQALSRFDVNVPKYHSGWELGGRS